jgi:tetratricopeptide (TPR) repeat protein
MKNTSRDAWKAGLLGDYRRAGSLYAIAGKHDKAIAMFLKARDYQSAADIEIQIGRILDAAKHLEEDGDFARAAELLKNERQFIRASKLFSKAGNATMAATMAKMAGNLVLAAEIEEKAGRFFQAGLYYRQGGQLDRAILMMEKALPQFAKAGPVNLYDPDEWQQARQEAARVFEEGKAHQKAAELYEEIGLIEKAARAYEAAKLYSKAAELYRQINAMEKVAQLMKLQGKEGPAALQAEALASQGDASEAAQLYAQAGTFEKGAALLEKAGDFLGAAKLWRQKPEWERAGNDYFRAGAYADAAECFREGHHFSLAMTAFEKAGNREMAMKMAYECGDWDKAYRLCSSDWDRSALIGLWQAVPTASPQNPLAKLMLARAFVDQGRPKLARECLKGLTFNAGGDNPWVEYLLARVAEALGETDLASDLYQQVLARDLAFEDAGTRLQALESAGGDSGPAQSATNIGPYAIQKKLGSGGMADVFLCKDVRSGQVVAVKVPYPNFANDEAYRKRFLLEGEIGKTLNHPGVVSIYEIGSIGAKLFIAMEYVEGRTLKDILAARKTPLSPNEATRLIQEVGLILRYTHQMGVIHRDLKPENILVLKGTGRIKVTDFGIAKRMDTTSFTAAGQVVGTPNYMAPEPFIGMPYDGRSDLYSLGAIYYEMLTLEKPFSSPTVPEILRKHQSPQRPRPSSVNRTIPIAVDTVVSKLLNIQPTDRFPNVEALLASIEPILGSGK